MTYEELAAQARGTMGPYCRACPVCNGRGCAAQIPGPGAKGSGNVAARNYEAWKDYRLAMDTIHDGFAASCGLLDERIRLYAIERDVTPEQLKAMDGKDQEYNEEIEWIKTVVLPYEEAAHEFIDGKNLIALFLYERWLESRR